MNWIERLPEIKGKDLYSQGGEGVILEYIFHHVNDHVKSCLDIGAGDGFMLSNVRHLENLGWTATKLDKIYGDNVTLENINDYVHPNDSIGLLSIDIDGNDYWILECMLSDGVRPTCIIAEFNPAFTDSRAIKYNPEHVWNGDDYYGFSFEAGVKLAERFGYKVIFQVADMNMILVRADLITVPVPPVTFKQNDFFAKSNRADWVMI